MMNNIAIIENNTIVNVIKIESFEFAQNLFPDKDLLDITNMSYLGIGSFKDTDQKWYPKKENEKPIWSEDLKMWVSELELILTEAEKTRPYYGAILDGIEDKPCIHYAYNVEQKEWSLPSPLTTYRSWADEYPEHIEWLQERTEVIILPD